MDNIFDKEACAIQQLLNDKHTLLEGYVTEQLFYNQFLKNNTIPFSGGWWMTNHKGIRLFFIVKEFLSDFEHEIISKIPYPHQCWQVYLKDEEFIFIKENKVLTQQEFREKYKLTTIREAMIASQDTRNKDRQNKSILFFKQNSTTKKIAVERKFANNFLTVHFYSMINVDFFTKKNNQFNIIEVKYKYESKDGYFGINTGQMEMFKFFMGIGFNIYHFILYNYTKDMNISIFGFLDLKGVKNWYHARINDSTIHGIGVAPKMTSVSGGFKQSYYKLSVEEIEGRKIALSTANY